MLRRLAAVALLAPLGALGSVSFDEYLARFEKAYGPEQYAERKLLFEQRSGEIEALNQRPGASWTAGLNEMTDMLPGELAAQRRGYNKAMREGAGPNLGLQAMQALVAEPPASEAHPSEAPPQGLPKDMDWRDYHPSVMTTVKQQGGCGSCWVFSATEAIESHVAINTGLLMDLSPQALTSCTPNLQPCGGGGGCQGATAQLAFNYTVGAGLSTIWWAPYTSGVSGDSGTCDRMSNMNPHVGITGYETLPYNDADALADAVANIGPVSVSVDASSWFQYDGGIFDGCNKTNPDINHAVQLAGFGEENGTKYWLVRNSWGSAWGEDGYIRLRRYDSEPCGMDVAPEHGNGCDGGASHVRVCGECGILSDSSYPTGAFVRGPRHSGGRHLASAASGPGIVHV